MPWNFGLQTLALELATGDALELAEGVCPGVLVEGEAGCVAYSWFFAGEKEVDFTRKNLPRLAILRSLIGRGCAVFGESDWP